MKKYLMLLLVCSTSILTWSQAKKTNSMSTNDSKKTAVKDTTPQPAADKTPLRFDLNQWNAVKDQTIRHQKGKPFSIVFENCDSVAFKKVLENSMLTGIYNKAEHNKKFSALETNVLKFDAGKKIGTVNMAIALSKFQPTDSLLAHIKKDSSDKGVKITILPATDPAPNEAEASSKNENSPLPQIIEAVPQELLLDYKNTTYPKLYKTDVGYKLPGDFYTIHIFLDGFGNPLFGSVPSGIQNKYHYQVHVLRSKNNTTNVFYFFNNIVGSLSDASVTRGAESNISAQQGLTVDTDKNKARIEVSEVSFNFFPTSDDLKFDVDAVVIGDKNQKSTTKLTSYTVKKTPFYSASLNIAGVYSWLSNPSYQLVSSPINLDKKTVKVTDRTTGLMVSILYTVYWSPVNALSSKEKRQRYSVWGRSYLDDDSVSIFRKIYPSIGFGLKDEVFSNIIAGFTVQPVKELGIFIGTNIRKVNTFNMPDFEEGKTDVNQEQFDYYQNTKWRSNIAIGVVIDVSIFSKILGNISAPSNSQANK